MPRTSTFDQVAGYRAQQADQARQMAQAIIEGQRMKDPAYRNIISSYSQSANNSLRSGSNLGRLLVDAILGGQRNDISQQQVDLQKDVHETKKDLAQTSGVYGGGNPWSQLNALTAAGRGEAYRRKVDADIETARTKTDKSNEELDIKREELQIKKDAAATTKQDKVEAARRASLSTVLKSLYEQRNSRGYWALKPEQQQELHDRIKALESQLLGTGGPNITDGPRKSQVPKDETRVPKQTRISEEDFKRLAKTHPSFKNYSPAELELYYQRYLV